MSQLGSGYHNDSFFKSRKSDNYSKDGQSDNGYQNRRNNGVF